MDTYEIANALKLTAQLMELHDENKFKVKSIANAAFKLGKSRVELEGLSKEELEQIEGIGKGIAGKIYDLQTTGSFSELDALVRKTPAGVIEMLGIKGIGPKKIAQLWKELEVESPGELLYACHENRLVDLKGFGAKTQKQVKEAIEFNLSNQGKFHYAAVEPIAKKLVDDIKEQLSTEFVSLTGAIRRKCEIIERIDILIGKNQTEFDPQLNTNIDVNFQFCDEKEFYKKLFESTGSNGFLDSVNYDPASATLNSEEEIFNSLKLPFIIPELREDITDLSQLTDDQLKNIVQYSHLKGALHNHTTYSDGVNTLEEMAVHCRELGYEYLGICDHSQSAFYANGLKPDRIIEQHKEIDLLNEKLKPFKIFKGIESDILFDGSLDYDDDVLASFDFVVASVHSNLKMSEEKATERIIRAIENPYTTILGHPTGRLLLSRAGYPLDHKAVIDACASNDVVIELNAHPYRLDIDWRWIPYCLQKEVKISINPDAHVKSGLKDMYFGTCAARKGGLTKEMCLNTLTLEQLEDFFVNRKLKVIL